MTQRILIVGGTANVGTRIVQLLNGLYNTEILIAGSNLHHTEAIADELQERALRVRAVDGSDIAALKPDVVIDASGPFQGRGYDVPRACIKAGSAYLDIADDNDFVCNISNLDAEAIRAGVPVLSGAGMVPSLSMAAALVVADGLDEVSSVSVWVTPGLQLMHGHVAYVGILRAAGRRFEWRRRGVWRSAYAWQGAKRVDFPHLGSRVIAPWNTPDLVLLPRRWPNLSDATVHGGSELGPLQRGLSVLGWLPRVGLGGLLRLISPVVATIARSSAPFGSNETGLRVTVQGRRGEQRLERDWLLHAKGGDGTFVAAAPAAALTRALLARMLPPGARVATLGLYDILAELRSRNVTVQMSEVEL